MFAQAGQPKFQTKDEQMFEAGRAAGKVMPLCCCMLFLAAFIALVVWLTGRGKRPMHRRGDYDYDDDGRPHRPRRDED